MYTMMQGQDRCWQTDFTGYVYSEPKGCGGSSCGVFQYGTRFCLRLSLRLVGDLIPSYLEFPYRETRARIALFVVDFTGASLVLIWTTAAA